MAVLGHVEQAQAGIAEGMGQILMGRAVEMPYFAIFIDQNDAGIEMLQQHRWLRSESFIGCCLSRRPGKTAGAPSGGAKAGMCAATDALRRKIRELLESASNASLCSTGFSDFPRNRYPPGLSPKANRLRIFFCISGSM